MHILYTERMYGSLLRRETGVGCEWTLIPRPDVTLRKDAKYWTKMILKHTTQNQVAVAPC